MRNYVFVNGLASTNSMNTYVSIHEGSLIGRDTAPPGAITELFELSKVPHRFELCLIDLDKCFTSLKV